MKSIISTIIAFASLTTFSFAHCGGCGTEKKKEAETVEVGEHAPEFSLKTAGGEEVTLTGLKGKEVVLEWINLDCPFVKKYYNEGHMQALQKTYTDKGVAWIIISSANAEHPTYKSPEALEAAVKEQKANATYALADADGTVGKAYDAKTTPHMYVIDKEGHLVYAGAIDSKKSKNTADIAESENYVAAALDALMAGEEVKTPETKAYGCSVKY